MSEQPIKDLVSLFESSVRRYGDRDCIGRKTAAGWQWTTYGELGREVDAARGALHAAGVRPGDRVGIIANNRLEWVVAAYATWGVGGVFAPMYEAQQSDEWEYILHDAEVKVLFVGSDALRARVQTFQARLPKLQLVVSCDGDSAAGTTYATLLAPYRGVHTAPVTPKPDDLAELIYTSGTTGLPKGVMLSHWNLVSNIQAAHACFPDITPNDRSLCFLPWAHCYGQAMELHFLLAIGASLALVEARDKILPNLTEIAPTILISVPHLFNRVYDGVMKKVHASGAAKRALFFAALRMAERRRKLSERAADDLVTRIGHGVLDRLVLAKIRERFGGRLRYTICGGAAISPEVATFLADLGLPIYEGYGLSEASPLIAVNTARKNRLGSIGLPIPGVRVELDESVANEPGQGELVAYGPNIMQGYLGLPDETRAAIRPDGGLRTGDLARRDADGFLFITGRLKEQYKLENGKYVAPEPLEEKLRLSPFISQVMVYGTNRPFNVAVIVPEPDNLRTWAKEHSIEASNIQALCSEPRTRALFEQQISKQLAGVKTYERVRSFVIADQEFTPENGMLTQSLKLKRREVLKRYQAQIEELYATKSALPPPQPY